MPTYDYFLLSVDEEVATLTINRPKALNAFNDQLWHDLLAFVKWVDTQADVRVVIITAEGERAFVAGADLNDLATMGALGMMKNDARHALNVITASPKVYIAAVNGFAFGAGTELSLACDLRIVSEKARFGLPETGLGLLPGAGGTQRLPKVVGKSVAKDMILAGRELTGAEAVHFGLAYKVVPPERLAEEAMALANQVVARSPLGTAFAKEAINYAFEVDEANGTRFESQAFGILLESDDMKEGVQAFFEKRPPHFKTK